MAEDKTLSRVKFTPGQVRRVGQLVGYNLQRASQVMVGDFTQSVNAFNVSRTQYRVLVRIYYHPGLNQSEAAALIGMQRTNFPPVIDELERRGLVVRERADGRSNALSLTEAGAAIVEALDRQIDQHEAKYAALMTPEEREVVLSVLTRIAALGDEPAGD